MAMKIQMNAMDVKADTRVGKHWYYCCKQDRWWQAKLDFDEANLKTKYFDEYTGEELDPKFVRKAMMEDLSYCNDKEDWHGAGVHSHESR